MPLGSSFANKLAQLILQAVSIANIADNAASTPDDDIIVSLHTSDPGAGGDVNTNKCTYGSYAPVAVPRDNTGWTDTGTQTVPAADIVFPASTGGADETATHLMLSTKAGEQIMRGTITPNIVITNGGDPPTVKTTTQINFLAT